MTTRNDVTGDEIKSKSNTNKYRNNWDQIFQKKQPKDSKKEDKSNGS